MNDVAWIPYTQPKGIWRTKTYIEGFNLSSLGLVAVQDWANVMVMAH